MWRRLGFRLLAVLALAGCSAPAPRSNVADARHRYLAAKAACDSQYTDSLVERADCRTRAANTFIRPYYRYDDLMSEAQERRKELAVEADAHRISRATYSRRVAESEREISREEDRRNRRAHVASSFETTPFTPVVATIARLFQ